MKISLEILFQITKDLQQLANQMPIILKIYIIHFPYIFRILFSKVTFFYFQFYIYNISIKFKMILQITLIVSILLLAGWYFLYYQPKKRIQNFANNAQALGYKVKLMPYQFMRYFLVKYLRQEQKTLRIFKQQLKQYDLIIGNMFTSLAIVPNNVDIIKDVYNQASKLPKNPFAAQTFLQFMNGGGLVFSEGQNWKKKRKIISSVFHFDFLNEMIPLITQEIQTQFKLIDKQIEEGKSCDMKIFSAKVLSSVVAKCFFGVDMNEYKIDGIPYCQYFIIYLDQIGSYGSSLQHMIFGMLIYKYQLSQLSRKMKQKYLLFNSIAKQITLKQLERIKNNQNVKKNLLTSLYERGLLTFDQKVQKDQYSLYDLIGEFFTFFSAGTDTTANSINLMLHYLSQNPKYIELIRKQNQEISINDKLTDSQKLKNMKWIDAIFNQVLRLNGPVSGLIPRTSIQNIQIGKLNVPKGSTITLMPIMNSWKSENFKNPEAFIPQRWLQQMKIQPFAYTPFGGGERNCIGQYLAKIQAKLMISKILERYDFKALNQIKMSVSFLYATKYSDFVMKKRIKNP